MRAWILVSYIIEMHLRQPKPFKLIDAKANTSTAIYLRFLFVKILNVSCRLKASFDNWSRQHAPVHMFLLAVFLIGKVTTE